MSGDIYCPLTAETLMNARNRLSGRAGMAELMKLVLLIFLVGTFVLFPAVEDISPNHIEFSSLPDLPPLPMVKKQEDTTDVSLPFPCRAVMS
jgi:hypothetical protein